MQCIRPISIIRPGGNGSNDRMGVPCGHCEACLERNRNQWSFRLYNEWKSSDNAYFVTLTYSTENTNGNVSKRDIQLFLKRLRKVSKFRYYFVSEYGPKTFRPHYHGIIFNFKASFKAIESLIYESWEKGFTLISQLNEARINYTTGYILGKRENPIGLAPNFCLMSRKPGIGACYIDKYENYHLSGNPKFYSVLPGGAKVSLPRYYQNKFYNNEERQQNAIDQQRRIEKNNSKSPADASLCIERMRDYQRKVNLKLTKNKKL